MNMQTKEGHTPEPNASRFYQMPSQIHQQDDVQFSVGTQIQLHNTLWKQQDFKKKQVDLAGRTS